MFQETFSAGVRPS